MQATTRNRRVLPVIPLPPAAAIQERIRHRQRTTVLVGFLLLFVGVPITLIGPLVMGTIFWLATANLWGLHPWFWFFTAIAGLMIPCMFWGEIRLRGSASDEGNLDLSPGGTEGRALSPLPMMVMGQFGLLVGFAANPRLAASGLVETFLLGPRLTLDGLSKLSRSWQLRNAPLDRSADIVSQLARESAAVPLESLLAQGEGVEQLVPALCLLLFQEWIGISRTGYRVWLLTDARKRLRP